MGLFGKKEKLKCPVCGREMTFLSQTLVADGAICENCAGMLRGDFDIESYWIERYDGTYRQKFSDPVNGLSTEDVRSIIARLREEQTKAVAAFGDRFPGGLFRAEESFLIAPKAVRVGVKRSKLLRDKCVVRGLVLSGEFSRGDAVTVIESGGETTAAVLDLIPCGSASNFDEQLEADMHKRTAAADTNAWLILDRGETAAAGTMIGKR